MHAENKTTSLPGEYEESLGLSVETQVQVLLAEYNRLSSEIKMLIEQYSPKFTLFAVFVLSAFAFAFQNPNYQIIYVVIPLFIFLIAYIQLAQVHIIIVLAGRIRTIEERIRVLNGGRPLLEWETNVTPELVYPPFVAGWPNPVFVSVIFVIIAVLPLLIFSGWRAYLFIPSPWNLFYGVLIGVFFLGTTIQGFAFFMLGKQIDRKR